MQLLLLSVLIISNLIFIQAQQTLKQERVEKDLFLNKMYNTFKDKDSQCTTEECQLKQLIYELKQQPENQSAIPEGPLKPTYFHMILSWLLEKMKSPSQSNKE